MRDWARAVKRVAKWEESSSEASKEQSVAAVVESYLGDCRSRSLKETSITSYRRTLDHLKTFCSSRRILYISALDLAALSRWPHGSTEA